jgi:primase-polymerase (primpol)-like protein
METIKKLQDARPGAGNGVDGYAQNIPPIVFCQAQIPPELSKLHQWVLWKSKPKGNGKTTKVLYSITGGKAKSNDPKTWTSFENVLKRYKAGGYDGIGYVFSPDDPFCGIDLDHCRDPKTGKIEFWALEIIKDFSSYTEISPSGTGVHIICKGKLPEGGRKKGNIEIYDKGRYFTVTGNRLDGTPSEINSAQEAIDKLLSSHFTKEVGPQAPISSSSPQPCESDPELIQKAISAGNGHKFNLLYQGQWQEAGYPSQSEADQAFCNLLAFWTGRDAARIDAIFHQSGLMRPKWDKKHHSNGDTYGRRTIDKAISSCQETYSQGRYDEFDGCSDTDKTVLGDTETGIGLSDNGEKVVKVVKGDKSSQPLQKVVNGSQSSQESRQSRQGKEEKTPYNLAACIKEWLMISTGSFTVDQLDREFGLTTRAEKKNRAKILCIYKEKNLISSDRRIRGRYNILDHNIEWIDPEKQESKPFPLKLPFDLHRKVSVFPKSIIIIAGSTNAGKTSLVLNILRLNMSQPYERVYLMSEMGGAEYRDRILKFEDDPPLWKERIKAASKSYGFNGIIKHYNPNGLTCIDYLEEIEGEYFKMASSIRDIYDSLNQGVAVVAIQKKESSKFARGGEATAEKARLYLSVDYLCTCPGSIACALKIVKAKQSIGEQMQNKELHFKIFQGSKITPLTDWQLSSQVDRGKCAKDYEEATAWL